MTSMWHPIMRMKYKIFLSAGGVDPNSNKIDEEYAERLVKLIRAIRPYLPTRSSDGQLSPFA